MEKVLTHPAPHYCTSGGIDCTSFHFPVTLANAGPTLSHATHACRDFGELPLITVCAGIIHVIVLNQNG